MPSTIYSKVQKVPGVEGITRSSWYILCRERKEKAGRTKAGRSSRRACDGYSTPRVRNRGNGKVVELFRSGEGTVK